MTNLDAGTDWSALQRSTTRLLNDFQTTQAALAQMPPELRAAKPGDRVDYVLDGLRTAKTFAARAAIGRGTKVRAGIRFGDGTFVELRGMTELTITPAPEATLPECARFAGEGQRCSRCRVRRAMHA